MQVFTLILRHLISRPIHQISDVVFTEDGGAEGKERFIMEYESNSGNHT